MKWNEPVAGDERVVCRFLLWPRRIGNEWRWLERATWSEVFIGSLFWSGWRKVGWIDSEVSR